MTGGLYVKKTGYITLLVKDINEAIEFYTTKFGFVVVENMQNGDFHWVTVAPQQDNETVFVLGCKFPGVEQIIGRQAGMAPLAIIASDNCREDVAQMKELGVEVVKEPADEFWGIDAWVKDLYGNIFNIVEVPTRQ